MVRLVGLEPTTYGLEVRCSIQLSYRRILFEIRLLSRQTYYFSPSAPRLVPS